MDCDSEACILSPPQRYESNQFGGGGVGISPVDYAYTIPLVVRKPGAGVKKLTPPKKQIGRGRKSITPNKKSAKKNKKLNRKIKKNPVVRGKPKKKGCGVQSLNLYK